MKPKKSPMILFVYTLHYTRYIFLFSSFTLVLEYFAMQNQSKKKNPPRLDLFLNVTGVAIYVHERGRKRWKPRRVED
ncbi:hypothetical protein COCSADRAFT_251305 [Bipolaris sorokiniana ND90Pr]|uniref:Uncharacterized protein n=1 Tax=Cochliobolus sativus (strain ND90Pr / ATCC 201652) TaxID=665912 RepID=M2RWU1_COCSN|nr:uncharacterized protein COCSADRAFT_251305 [Bipolaris sorokiniana ND90Pr]EMD59543.1 hypothetical protein COCSADRAFT_251305 [Bipolaris sorokiniana ND90Pr]